MNQSLCDNLAMAAFTGITTNRLIIRAMATDDAHALWRRRNDPEAAKYQSWTLPYPREKADETVSAIAATDGPTNDNWWMAIVADRTTGETLGDLALRLTCDERVAEIGYTFSPEAWGRGFAVEAAAALSDWLIDEIGVSRVCGMTHPDNVASNMVLERIGMRFEGHTRNSYWVGDDNSDDWIFGMTPHDRRSWRSRTRTPPNMFDSSRSRRPTSVSSSGSRPIARSGRSQPRSQTRLPASRSRRSRTARQPDPGRVRSRPTVRSPVS